MNEALEPASGRFEGKAQDYLTNGAYIPFGGGLIPKAAIAYARKLDALRHCPILMQYHHQEIVQVKRKKVMVVISELVEGQKLSEFLHSQPRHKLSTFEALHVLYALAKVIAPIATCAVAMSAALLLQIVQAPRVIWSRTNQSQALASFCITRRLPRARLTKSQKIAIVRPMIAARNR